MKNVYFIGINGIGMSALAKIMISRGYNVSGGDTGVSKTKGELESLGIKIYPYHKEENIDGIDLVVRSSAIKEDNPEYKRAIREEIEVIKRGELLGRLMNAEDGIAVAGTHGKTTTSSMLGEGMLSVDPTIVVGGIVRKLGSNARVGRSDFFVAEADESDNSFLYLTPRAGIITNIEADHLENHGTFENIKKSFKKFASQVKEVLVVNIDCPNTRELFKGKDVVTYSILDEVEADIKGSNIEIIDGKINYLVTIGDDFKEKFTLKVPGLHNVSNSLPVIYLALKYGVEVEELKVAISEFKGARRRYDILSENSPRIIDDYAHHPTEIKATLEGAKDFEKKKLVAIFEPHRYSRLKFLLDDFGRSFEKADEVILLPVYSAGEIDEFGVSLEDLKGKIDGEKTKIVEDYKELENIIEKNDEKTYIFMGAGSVSKIAHELKDKIKGR